MNVNRTGGSLLLIVFVCVCGLARTAPSQPLQYSGFEGLQTNVPETEKDEVPPELLELYRDVELMYAMENSNVTETREGRGLLSKLSFLTGLKLGSLLTSSGTLAASQSIRVLGKVMNAALSVSYGPSYEYPTEVPEVVVHNDPEIHDRGSAETVTKPNVVPVFEKQRNEFLKKHNERVVELNKEIERRTAFSSRVGRTSEDAKLLKSHKYT